MNRQLTFQELKNLVSVIDVATYIGYRFDRSKGLSQPSFVRTEGKGEIEDRIYIKNPQNNSSQGYWRRTGYHSSGDVISFIKEHLDEFSVSGRNEIDRINKILHKFAGREFVSEIKEYKSFVSRETVFEPDRWILSPNSTTKDRILSSRSIDSSTALTFSRHIHTIQDRNQNGRYTYIGFPYTIPGSLKTVGYEMRGVGGFKSKASGTDSTNGMWIASFTDNPFEVKNIFITESAFDALAFYQLHKARIDLRSSVFVSFGGSFSDQQLSGIGKYYQAARFVLLFDKDLNGHMYDIRALSLIQEASMKATIKGEKIHFSVNGKSFDIESSQLSVNSFAKEAGLSIDRNKIIVHKPQGDIKDWNDVLKTVVDTPSKYAFKR